MVTGLPTRRVVRTFKDAGWRRVRTVGSHSVYDCPCGQHSFSLPDGHKEISAGVVRQVTKALAECEGMES